MTVKTKLGVFCDRVIEAGWLAAVVVVPLFFNVYSSRVFEPDKISTLRSIAVVMVGAWIIRLIEQGFERQDDQDASSAWVTRLWRRLVETPLALPTLALVTVYLVATAFSVVPRTSFLGSYQRLQGTYSTLSYIVVFAMMLQGVRTKAQVERFVTTVVLTSIPIALYGILQHYGLDPLPWGGDVRTRVAGNMGNAIFIAAYMIMALPLTLYRTVESFTEILTAEESRAVDIVLGAAYIFVLAIQAICIFFTQSRGPWLGLLGGLFFFFLVLAVVRRWRWLVWGAIVAIVAMAIFLIVFNLPSTPLEPLKEVPYIGRLGHVLDKEEGTSKVRLLIWEGAIDMILPHPPLQKPDKARDWMNWARPFIGYGPESMYVAYNRFYPPDLAHYERRNASPDRSHNETFDSLVITGLIGFLVYMWLFASVFYYGFRWLGVIAGKAQRRLFLGCWIGGGVAGALVMGLWQGAEFVGVGLPAGIAAGLGVYLVIWGLFLSRGLQDGERVRPENPFNLLVVALVAAVIAHFVEIHFGIAIGATRTYFWAYLGLLVVVGYLMPRHREVQSAEVQSQAAAAAQGDTKRRRRRKRSPSSPQRPSSEQGAIPSGLAAALPYALILALILSTLAYDFVSNQKQLDSPQQIVWTSLTRRVSDGEFVPSYGVLGLLGITWALGSTIVVAEWLRRGGQGDWRGPFGACLSISLFVAFLFAMILAGRLSGVIQRAQLLGVTRMIEGMPTSYYVLVFGLIGLTAFALVRRSDLPTMFWQPASWWAYPILLVGVVLVVINTNLKPIHADICYKQAEPYERQQLWDFSIVLHQEAIRLVPTEDFYYLFLGRAFLEKAKSAPALERPAQTFSLSQVLDMSPQQMDGLSRDDLLNCSDLVLERAREINPLNTDHSANLGRLYRTRAELTSDRDKQNEYFGRSLDYYAQATLLSPNAAHLFDEWGLVYAIMGAYDEAIAKYEHSLEIDREYVNTYLSLGDAYMALNETDKAQDAYTQAVAISPQIPEVHSVLAYLYGKEGRIEEAIAETLLVLDLSTQDQLRYNSYKNLALFYQEAGRLEDAMRAAHEALALAPDNERAAVQGLIAQLSAGGVEPETEAMVQDLLAQGEAALNDKNWEEARGTYEKALALNPDLVVAHSALSYVYAQQGRLEDAERENQFVLAAMPGDFATLKNLAIIYRQLNRYSDSIDYAQQALASPQATAEDKEQLQLFIDEVRSLEGSG
jgi:tetratricopeptide (TPR) repeat protein/O-antigen ligase